MSAFIRYAATRAERRGPAGSLFMHLGGAGTVADIFISYSRRDSAFVHTLNDVLAERGRNIWVDWEDIPPSADWFAKITQLRSAVRRRQCLRRGTGSQVHTAR
jgi:hypothetical protein